MIDRPLYEKIEAYLLGQLSPKEASTFGEEIERDPKLSEAVELHRLSLGICDKLAKFDLQDSFNRWRQELKASPASLQKENSHKALEKSGISKKEIFYSLRESESVAHYNINLRDIEYQKTYSKKYIIKRLLIFAEKEIEIETRIHANISEGFHLWWDLDRHKSLEDQISYVLKSPSWRRLEPVSMEILAFLYFKNKQYQDAINTYKKFIEHNPDVGNSAWLLSLYYISDYSQYKSEISALLKIILEDPIHPDYERGKWLKNIIRHI